MPIPTQVASLKASMAALLSAADSSVAVKTTDYFNHTYAPDIVMRWPNDKTERRVYLRTTDVERYLEEDIESLGELHPMLVPLGGMHDDRPDATLESAARSATALVTEPTSLEAFSVAAQQSPVVRLASKAVLQGGVGVVGEHQAVEFSAAIANGFDNATRGQTDGTSDALRFAEFQLDPARAVAVSDFLHAVWVGSGADAMSFPGSTSLAPTFQGDALELLLDTVEIDDQEFWDRVAKRLTLADLARLTRSGEHANFQRLVSGALRGLTVKAIRMTSNSSEHLSQPRWSAGAGLLHLGVGPSRFSFAPRNLDEFVEEGVDLDLSARAFVQRARTAGASVSAVSVEVDDRVVDYSSVDGSSVTEDDRLLNVADSVGRGRVRSASVTAAARNLQIHFDSSTAYGVTRTQFPLVPALTASLSLLTEATQANVLAEEAAAPAPGDS